MDINDISDDDLADEVERRVSEKCSATHDHSALAKRLRDFLTQA